MSFGPILENWEIVEQDQQIASDETLFRRLSFEPPTIRSFCFFEELRAIWHARCVNYAYVYHDCMVTS